MFKKEGSRLRRGALSKVQFSCRAQLGVYVFLAASRCLFILWFVFFRLPMFPLACIVEVATIENLCFGNSQQLEELGGICFADEESEVQRG